jgi:hypothetical protein
VYGEEQPKHLKLVRRRTTVEGKCLKKGREKQSKASVSKVVRGRKMVEGECLETGTRKDG